MRLFVFILSCWLLPLSAYGQACYLQQECGPGLLCSASGTCQPIRTLLDTGSNTVYWVDQARGDDAGNGSESKPFKTIQRAVRGDMLKPGDAVVIREGTYYEQVAPGAGGTAGRMVTIAAYPGDEVVVSGAISLDGEWRTDGDAWKIDWPFEPLWTRMVANDPFGPARRRDVVIADGQMLLAVYTRSDVREGTFFLEGSPSSPTTLYVRLPGSANPNQTVMQTSRINHLFNPSNNEPNCLHGQINGYFHLIGLTFRHAANDGQMGAVCAGDEGSLLENITVEWTNGSGFLISGKNHIVRGVRALYNGMSGIRGANCNHCLLEYATSRYNNWKGYKTFWESGGGKWVHSTNSTFRKLDFSENLGPGLWLDIDNTGNTIKQSWFDGNLGAGLFIENKSHKNLIINNAFTRARYAEGSFYGHGLLIHAASNNVVLFNTFMGNEGGGMRIRADSRDRTTGNRYFNNLFVANQKLARGTPQRSSEISFEEHANDADARTNKGDGNFFWHRNYADQSFHTFQYRPKTAAGSALKSSTLTPWQERARTDYHSKITDPGRPNVKDTTDFIAGWRLPDDSQYLGQAVALPGDITPVPNDFDGTGRPPVGGAVGADQPSDLIGGVGGGDGISGSGDGAFSRFTRVQFVRLGVQHTNDLVTLTWVALNEAALRAYVLERSTDGAQFTELGSIDKIPPDAETRHYEYRDRNLPVSSGTLYYRIKNVYIDRSFAYSSVAIISLDQTDGTIIHPSYPNPARQTAQITYDLPETTGVKLKLYDALGREVKTLVDTDKPAGRHILYLDAAELASGVYYYRFEAGGVVKTHTMTVVH